MLRRDWNQLRTRDRVLVHHTIGDEPRLVEGVVINVVFADNCNEVSVRVTTDVGVEVITPSRPTVHGDPIELDGHCWRCASSEPATSVPKRSRG